jgi:hypothetical protein
VCEAVAQGIAASTDDVMKKRIEDAKSSGRVLLNVLELDGSQPTVPQILEVAPSVFNGKKGVGGIISLFDEWPNMLDPMSGNDIIIEKSGAGLDTAYGVSVAGSSRPVPPEVLTKLNDLDAYVMQENEQAQMRALASVRAVAGLPAPTQSYAPAALPAGAANAYTAQPAPAPWEADETLDIGTLSNPAAAATVAAGAVPIQPAVVVQPTAEVAAAVAAVATQPVAQPAAVAQPAVVAAPAPAAVVQAAPAAGAGTGDPELDALLAGL